MITKRRLYLVLAVLGLLLISDIASYSQCTFGGNLLSNNVTPTSEGETITLNNIVTAGDQLTLNATVGCTYTVSTCGSSWNTFLTIFDPSDQAVAWNDNSCGNLSEVTFTASVTGAYTIQLNRHNCNSSNWDAEVFSVTLDSCVPVIGCTDSNACNFQQYVTASDPTLCCFDYCSTLQLYDSESDGWEGATYTVFDNNGNAIQSGTLSSGDYERINLCLSQGCYSLEVTDGTDPDDITWSLQGNGFGLVSGGANSMYHFSMGGVNCGCSDPTACNFDATVNIDNGTCCYGSCATITIGGGNNPDQISWEILDGGGNVVMNGAGANNTDPDVVCLDGCYTLNLYDSGGNGWEGSLIMIEGHDGTILFAGSLSGFASSGAFNVCSDYPLDFQCEDVSPPGCPSIYAGEDIINSCLDPCVDLVADVFETGETNTYKVETIPYAPVIPYEDGVQVSIGIDDIWSYEIPLPFEFCFYGIDYNRMLVGSNGLISFNTASNDPLGWCEWEFTQTIPNSALPLAMIGGPYHDIDPSVCGTVTYSICGVEPCRFAVINYHDVCHYQCNELLSSCQIVIYETTNVVEVYMEDKPTCETWNNGNGVIGLQNETGTQGIVAPGRQTGNWTASNEAWRFTPDGASNFEVSWWHGGTMIGTGLTVPVCAVESPNVYRAEAIYTNCNGDQVTVSDEVVVQCSFAMLPVELLSFEAEVVHGEVVCYWSTASETDNDYFTIERSLDGANWEKVGVVDGAGTSLETRNYSFWDHDPYPGVSYYRLMQTDFNGDFDFSEIRAVEIDEDFGFVVFPNPNHGTFNVKYPPLISEIKIRDIRGRLVDFEFVGPAEITMLGAAQGTYFIEMFVSENKLLLRERFMVK